eukprot:m.241676 g.241676  ORF g.241676 m.241676 type:complete len:591 (-) comp24662_c0_seq1:35-1807(-)
MALRRRSGEAGAISSDPNTMSYWNATQEDADAVVDVLLSAAADSEEWSSESGIARESPQEGDEQESAGKDWWAVEEESLATPPRPRSGMLQPSSSRDTTPHASSSISQPPGGEQTAVKSKESSASNFNRFLTRSMAKRKQAGPASTPAPAPAISEEAGSMPGPVPTLSVILDDAETDEAVEAILSTTSPAANTPAPTNTPSSSSHSTRASEGAVDGRAEAERYLVFSVDRGAISQKHALAAARAIDNELRCLVELIKRVGRPGLRGRVQLTYGALADHAQDVFNPLASIVKTARTRGIVSTDPELLHQSTTVTLLCDVVKDATLDTYTFQHIKDHSVRRQSFKAGRKSQRRLLPTTPHAPTAAHTAQHTTASTNLQTGLAPAGSMTSASESSHRGNDSSSGRKEAPALDDLAAQLALLDAAQASVIAAAPPGPTAASSGLQRRSSRAVRIDPLAAVQQMPDTAPALQQSLAGAVRRGTLSSQAALTAARWVDKELHKLVVALREHGAPGPAGSAEAKSITYGELTRLVGHNFNPLSGVVKTAASRGVVTLAPSLLLPRTVITLVRETFEEAGLETYSYQQVRQCSMRRGR